MGTQLTYKGSGSLTREQFLFNETRIVSRLMVDEGLSDDDIVKKINEENLFQFPTERMVKNIANVCIRRLRCLDDISLINVIAHRSVEDAKQACLYAMMRQYRLVWEFMITVIGKKYEQQDFSYGKIDLNIFFSRLQEQNDEIAAWSDSTLAKIKQVLNRILVENEYIDNTRSKKLNSVLISPDVENGIRANNDEIALPAFNCFL